MSRIVKFGALLLLGGAMTSAHAQNQAGKAGALEFDIQAAFSGWLARETGGRDLVEIAYTYSAQLLPQGRKLVEIEDQYAKMPILPSIEKLQVRVKVITDGLRFRLDYVPDADGRVRLPLQGHASPYALYDGKLYATSSGDGGISISDMAPYLGCPLPQEPLELIPSRMEIGPVHLWSVFCAGGYGSWFSKAQKLGKISAKKVDGKLQIEATAPSGGEGDEEFVLLRGNPLAPELVESGYSEDGRRVAYTQMAFEDYQRVGNWTLPRRATATKMLYMPLAVYGGIDETRQKIDRQLKDSGMFNNDLAAVYKQEIIIDSISLKKEDNDTFRFPLRPGMLVHDRVNNVDYHWGEKIHSLEGQLKTGNKKG